MKQGDNEKRNSFLEWLNEKKTILAKKNTFQYVIMIFCVGIGLMILGNFFQSDENNSSFVPVLKEQAEEDEAVFRNKGGAPPETMEDYEIRYENQLKEVLEQMTGVSDVSIMVNLAETEKYVYERNVNTKHQKTDEADREGGTRKVDDLTRDEQLVIIRKGDGEEPLLVKKQKPDIKGVLVVAQGVENIQVKSWVIEAVSRALDVPPHRVSVMPKKMKEE